MVGKPAGRQLTRAPDDGVRGGDDRDLTHAGAVRGEVERCEAPGERVVQVVDETRLAACAQDRVAYARVREGAAKSRVRRYVVAVFLLLERDLRSGVADSEHADAETDDGDQGGA